MSFVSNHQAGEVRILHFTFCFSQEFRKFRIIQVLLQRSQSIATQKSRKFNSRNYQPINPEKKKIHFLTCSYSHIPYTTSKTLPICQTFFLLLTHSFVVLLLVVPADDCWRAGLTPHWRRYLSPQKGLLRYLQRFEIGVTFPDKIFVEKLKTRTKGRFFFIFFLFLFLFFIFRTWTSRVNFST